MSAPDSSPSPAPLNTALEGRQERFEAAWRSWSPGASVPRWEEFLPPTGEPCTPNFAFILIEMDVEFRLKAGLPALLAEPYFQHPRLQTADAQLDAARQVELIRWEYQQHWKRGSRAARSAYVERFPEHAAALQDLKPHWSCPHCQRTSIPLDDEAALQATCPSCLRIQPLTELFTPTPTPRGADGSPGKRAGSPPAPRPAHGTVLPTEMDGSMARQEVLASRVPGYEVLGELGRGGMGVVYKARQINLKRLVALKMILAGSHASQEQLDRFRAEAEAVARLQHPNVVQVYEVGEVEGLPYFSLEYVTGGSLAARLDGTPWLARPAARLVEVLARAMHAAHQRGIVHRDLKPANVLLAPTDSPQGLLLGRDNPDEERFEPKVTDFGLAKRLDEGGLTQSGAVMGTPSYMAPEQARGIARQVGPLADVYALGAVLYELLTGRPPFKAATPLDTIFQVVTEDPVPPSRLHPKLPRDLETICLKCLEKDPARRYADSQELADDLGRFLQDEPIRARTAGPIERTLKWARRNRLRAALAGAIVLGLLALVGAIAFYARYKGQETSLLKTRLESDARHRQQYLQAEEDRVNGRLDEAYTGYEKILASLKTLPDLGSEDLRTRVERHRDDVRHLLDRQQQQKQAVSREKTFLGPYDDALTHEILTLLTGVVEATGNRARARDAARKALAVYHLDQQTDPADGSQLEQDRSLLDDATYARVAGGCYEMLLIWAEAEADPTGKAIAAGPGPPPPPADPEAREQRKLRARQALALLDRADRLGQALGLNTRAFHLHKARYTAWAAGEEFDAARIAPAVLPEPKGVLDWFLEGLERFRAGQYDQALVACREVLKQQETHFWARCLQALCHLRAERWFEARDDLTDCVKQKPAIVWPRLLLGFATSEIGYQHAQHKEVRLAAQEFRRAVANFDLALLQDPDPLVQYVALANRGVLEIRRQQLPAAIRDLREALRVYPEGFQAYVNLAQALQAEEKWDEAVAMLNQAIRRVPNLASLYRDRARLELKRKHRVAARADFQKAIDLEPPGSKSERLVSNLVELGLLLHQEGQYLEALPLFDRALQLNPNFGLARRYRAETLLALHREGEAAQELDRYLETTRPAPAEVYQARGLIFAGTKQLPAAIGMYTLALEQNPHDHKTRCYRGWTYLLTDAVRLALEDFEACLREKELDAAIRTDALAGRGSARIRLKQLEDALDDAQAAEKQGHLTDRILYHLCRLYAQVVGQLQLEVRAGPPAAARLAAQRLALYEEKALDCLRRSLEMMPEERRRAFWRANVQDDPALAPVRGGKLFSQLAAQYGKSASPK